MALLIPLSEKSLRKSDPFISIFSLLGTPAQQRNDYNEKLWLKREHNRWKRFVWIESGP